MNTSTQKQSAQPSQPLSQLAPCVDLSVFKLISSTSATTITLKCNDAINLCASIQLLLTGLRYYSLMDIKSNKNHQHIFSHFIHEIYTPQMIIMNYFHIQKAHGHQIYDIMNLALNQYGFSSCDIDFCPYSSRLYRVSEAAKTIIIASSEKDNDPSVTTISDAFDGIHHFIFHLFETGFRSIKDKDDDD
eukprot:201642_1